MDMFDSILSADVVLNKQLVPRIFEILPENGPVMVVMDKHEKLWLSNSEEFLKLNMSKSFLKELCARVDDGMEPVIAQAGDIGIAAAQLVTETRDFGYVFITLPNYNPESAQNNIGLVEAMLNQIALITELIETNNLLRERQIKLMNMYAGSKAPSN
jgi:hypothetical protein